MQLPFTTEQFFEIFREYNEAVWPTQVGLTMAAVAVVAAVTWPRAWTDRFVSATLALLWAWLAVAYHFAFFARINPVAFGFAALSMGGAGVFLWVGVIKGRLRFQGASRAWVAMGYALVVYALAVYPLISIATGHSYPAMPTFGLPCPTTIFTIGTLTFLPPRQGRVVFIVPVLWSLVGVQAAFLLGVPGDLALLVAGAVGITHTLSS